MMSHFDVRAADERFVWHPYTQHGLNQAPIPIARAEGAYLYDENGRRIFDAVSSWWVTLHGHAHQRITAAIAEQAATLEQVIFAGFTHEPAARLAAELIQRAPGGLQRVFYSDDGSTAIEVAVKMALQYHRNRGEERRLVAALENAYHGDTFGAMSVSARGLFTEPFTPLLFDVARLPDPVGGDVVGALEQLIAARGRELAAVIVEPMLLGAGGMRMWPADALRGLREVTAAHGIPLIADEVLTGFGRTGPLFACEHAGVSPDLMCLSKGLTGGYLPLSAVLATETLYQAFYDEYTRLNAFLHSHSYTGNPLACAAALASLRIFDEDDVLRRNLPLAGHLGERARTLDELEHVAEVRQCGMIVAAEMIRDKDSRTPYDWRERRGLRVYRHALEQGVLLRPIGNVIYFMPPYVVTPGDIDRMVEVALSSIEAATCD